MLNKLSITKFSYDWREEHISSFDDELEALQQYHIKLQAVWMPYGPDPVANKHFDEILNQLKSIPLKHNYGGLWIIG